MARCSSPALMLACSALLVALVGCGPTVEDRLAGKWTGTLQLDPAAVDRKVAEATDPVMAMIGKAGLMALGSQAQFEIDLQPGGTFSSDLRFNAFSRKESGNWKVKEADAKRATIVISEKNGTREHVLDLDPDFMKGTGGFTTPTWAEAADLGTVKFTRVAEAKP